MAQKGVAASSTKDDHASSVSFHTSLPTSQNGIAPSSQIGAHSAATAPDSIYRPHPCAQSLLQRRPGDASLIIAEPGP